MEISRSTDEKEIRRHFLKQRNSLSLEERKRADEQIFCQLTKIKEIQEAEAVYVYASLPGEADTKKLIDWLFKRGKIVAVPKVHGKEMAFYRILGEEDLEPGFREILEPKSDCQPVKVSQAVVVVPGVVFDRTGNRMGYGGGYYDRFLKGVPEYLKIGICFLCQLTDRLYPKPWDIEMDMVVTETGVIKGGLS